MRISLVIWMTLLALTMSACSAGNDTIEEKQETVSSPSSNINLSYLSIKALAESEGYRTTSVSDKPWPAIEADVDDAISETFMGTKPLLFILDARTYKTSAKADEAYNAPQQETLSGSRIESEEKKVINGEKATARNIRTDTGGYVVQVTFREGKTVVMLLAVDRMGYQEQAAEAIAEAVAKRLRYAIGNS